MVVSLSDDFTSFQKRYDQETGILLEQIRHLRDKLFGRKSEKMTSDSGAHPLPLFDLPEPEDKDMPAEEIYLLRQERSKPLLEEFRQVNKEIIADAPKGLLGKAISYTLKLWDRLAGYIESGIRFPDNNAAENSIRPFVVGRKNWLFAGTPEGATASAALYSLIETAKANDLEPYSYLRYIFDKLPTTTTLEDLEALLPWRLDKKKLYLASLAGGED